MKNIKIRNIIESYQKTNGELKLPASVAWKRRLNIKKLSEIYAEITDAIQEIQKEYADEDHAEKLEDGNWRVKPEYIQDVNARVLDVLEQDSPIDIQTITIDELDGISISDIEMDTIEFMIEG